jgi:hypothetical protein
VSKRPLENDFGVDKLDLIFQSGEYAFSGERPKNWTEKTFKSDASVTTEFFHNNTDLRYNADIVPDTPLKKGYLHISANPSKISHDYELTNDSNKIFDYYRNIVADLNKQGIETDLASAKICRLDLAKNFLLDHDLPTYSAVLEAMPGKRQFSAKYEFSHNWKNKEHQFIIYPKKRELITQNKKFNNPNIPNITRSEVKALKGRSVSRIIGIKYLGDIIGKTFVEEYNLYVADKILRTKYGQQLKFDYEYLEESYLSCVDKYGKRSALSYFLKIVGIETISSQPHGLKYLNEILKSQYSERGVRNAMAKINEILSTIKPVEQNNSENFIELNSEIRQKLLIA